MATVELGTSHSGDPTWEIAHLFPNQGTWTVDEYLALNTNHLVEFSDGVIETLPMPTEQHQLLVGFLYELLRAFVIPRTLGTVLFAPFRIKLWERKFREPDVVFMSAEHASRRGDQFWSGADLVMEVVSTDEPVRDLVTKRYEYAQAGIAEYWIVDPRDQTITVLALESAARQYTIAGRYARGATAPSAALNGFTVEVSAAFSQA
jgi:Uma2 family endonuclease